MFEKRKHVFRNHPARKSGGESRGNSKMAPWMWIARENTRVKTARNFHFKTKNLLKWTMLESRQKTKRKVVRLNYILGFIFNFVLLIIYIALQLFEIVHVVAHRAIKLKLLVALVSFNSPLATVRPSIFSPACTISINQCNSKNFIH